MSTRRDFFKTAAAGAAGAYAWPSFLPALRFNAPGRAAGLNLGVASYSLRKFTRSQAIAMMKELGITNINIKSFHLDEKSTPDEIRAGRMEFEDAGLKIVGGGNITIHEDTDEYVRSVFEYAKAAGFPLIVCAPKPEVVPRLEKFVKEYNIKAAIHNHGPEDKYFPGPKDVLAVVKGMDPRIGCCVDVGHTTRTGVDVVEAIAEAGPRVLDMHMKDLSDLMDRDSQVAVGEGKMPIVGIFKQLMAMNYAGHVNLEYEIFADDPMPGMKQSFSYMRGVIDALTA
jgi:sugar phosphate isomerase/epimerase